MFNCQWLLYHSCYSLIKLYIWIHTKRKRTWKSTTKYPCCSPRGYICRCDWTISICGGPRTIVVATWWTHITTNRICSSMLWSSDCVASYIIAWRCNFVRIRYALRFWFSVKAKNKDIDRLRYHIGTCLGSSRLNNNIRRWKWYLTHYWACVSIHSE